MCRRLADTWLKGFARLLAAEIKIYSIHKKKKDKKIKYCTQKINGNKKKERSLTAYRR